MRISCFRISSISNMSTTARRNWHVILSHLPITALKLYSGAVSHGEWRSFLDEALSSSRGPLLASLSAFWLRLSEKASSLRHEGKGNRFRMAKRTC